MPYLKLRTNVAIEAEQTGRLMSGLSQLLARETGKPERYVMVEIASGRDMIFSGSREPLAYLECKSIGLSAAQAKSISAAVSGTLLEELKLPPDRVYIEFSHCPAEFWGWNGSTFG